MDNAFDIDYDISDNGALTSLNLAKNHLGSNRGKYKYDGGNSDLDIDEHWEWHTNMSGVVAIADVIGDMRALTRLDISKNQLFNRNGTAAGKILRDMLAVNSTIQELDVSGNALFSNSRGGPSFAKALSVVISDNGALLVLDVSSNKLTQGAETFYNNGNHRGYETDMTGACCNCLLPLTEIAAVIGIIALADAIPDMGGILSLNLLKNGIGVEQARALVIILKEHSTLKSLCGNNGDETELDMSNKMKGAEDAIMLAAEIIDNRALLVLSLESNNLRADGGKALAEGIKGNQVITELNIADNNLANSGTDMSGAIALADAIPDMGALSSLNLAQNSLGQLVSEGGWILNDSYPKCYRNPDGKNHTKEKPEGEDFKPRGVIAIANAIPDMGALSVLSLKKNALGTKAAGKVLGEMLKENSLLKELDLSDNSYKGCGWKTDPEFAEELVAGIKNNGAISTVIMHKFPLPIQEIKAKAKLELSSKKLGVLDAIVIAALLPLNVSGAVAYPCSSLISLSTRGR
jgi:Leucine-rich repeat (LRR) protein